MFSRRFTVFLFAATLCGCASVPVPPASNSEVGSRSGVEIVGEDDQQLISAGARVIQSLGSIAALGQLTSVTGLSVYPAMSCEASEIDVGKLPEQGSSQAFFMRPCYDEGLGTPEFKTWMHYFAMLQESPALSQTERIVLNQPFGIGIDTGTSYLVERRFTDSDHKLIAYIYLGSEAQNYRDWEEVGLVFEQTGRELKLVAIYHDHFFHV